MIALPSIARNTIHFVPGRCCLSYRTLICCSAAIIMLTMRDARITYPMTLSSRPIAEPTARPAQGQPSIRSNCYHFQVSLSCRHFPCTRPRRLKFAEEDIHNTHAPSHTVLQTRIVCYKDYNSTSPHILSGCHRSGALLGLFDIGRSFGGSDLFEQLVPAIPPVPVMSDTV